MRTGDSKDRPARNTDVEPVALELEVREPEAPLSEPEIQGLLADLGDANKQVQRQAAQVLAERPSLRLRLLQTLQSSHVRQRWGAAYALSLRGTLPREAFPVLIERLGDADGDIRWAARDILLRWQDAIPLGAELMAAATRGVPAQRKMVAYTLRDLRLTPDEAAAVGLRLLEDDDAGVRMAALACVAIIVADKALAAAAILKLLADPDAGVCRAAAATLGNLGYTSTAVCVALRAVCSAPDPSLQRAAAAALSKLNAGP